MYIMCLSKGVGAMEGSISDGILPTKTLGFIVTAGEPYKDPYFVDESRLRLQQIGIKLVEIDTTNSPRNTIINQINTVDGVFVAGGNTFYLLQQLRAKNIDEFITEKVKNGMPYFGESAGAVLLTKSIEPATALDNPKEAPNLTDYTGLNLTNFFPLPHSDREKYHEIFAKFVADNEKVIDIVKYNDDQAILTNDGKNYEILTSEISKL